jgi:hypothetical protein
MGKHAHVRSRVLGFAAPLAVAALLVPPAGASQLPGLGVANGVRVSAAGANVTLTLTPTGPVYRRVRGARLTVRCYRVSAFPTGPSVGDATGQTVGVRRGEHRIRLALPTQPKPSFCVLSDRRSRELAAVAVTHEGAVWLDERRTAQDVQAVVTGLSLIADDRGGTNWPSPTDVSAAIKTPVTLLPSADTPAPPTGIAVFSDGARHLRVAERSSLGRELYIEYRDDALISNAVPYLEFG